MLRYLDCHHDSGLFEDFTLVQPGMRSHRFASLNKKLRTALLAGGLLLGVELLPLVASAQVIDSTGGSQTDSLCGGTVRPRRSTFVIEAFPSPAVLGARVTIQYYNNNPEVIALRVVDLLDRTIASGDLQTKSLTPNGLHTFSLPTRGLATGMYFIRLTTYTATGSVDQVQNSRFVIVH